MPNTISDLNDFSNGSLTYEDQRAYSIAFSANATTNQSVSTTEDVAFASPVGIDIVSVISQPGNITYNIDTSNIGSNAIVTWANIPATVSSSSPSTGVYSLTGYWDDVVWNAVKSPQITAKDQASNFVYSANIQYPTVANVANTATWSWTVNVAVSNSHAELSSATNFVYDEDVPMTISGTPTITDAYSGPLSHVLTITPNVANAVYSLSVASSNVTSNLNPTTKVLTLTGTKANVNTALGNVWLIPGIDYEQNFQLTYQLTNPVSNLQTSVTQQANIGNVEVDFYLQPTYSYDEDGQTQIVFSADDSDTTLVSLTIALTQTSGTNGTMLVNGVNAGTGNTAVFTGSRAAFNAANITFYPYPDSTGSVVLSANVSKINGAGNSAVASNVTASLTVGNTHSDYSLTTSYNYSEDSDVAMVWDITDTDIRANSYTSTFTQTSGNSGVFLINGTSQGVGNAAVVTGNLTTVNAANVTFVPYPDYTGNIAIGYDQSKINTLFGNVVQATNVAIAITNTGSHADYSLTTSYNFAEDSDVAMVWDITDTDVRATSYTSTFTQTTGTLGAFLINGTSQGVGNAAVVTGNLAIVNAANVTFVPYPDDTGNITIGYDQTKINSLFGNVVQATNVNITVNCTSTHNEYSWADTTYDEDTRLNFGNTILDVDSRATSYTLTFLQTAGNIGQWYRNGVSQGLANVALTVTNTKANLNNSFSWQPPIDYTGNVTIAYSQSKSNNVFGNIVQASNVVANLTIGNTNPEITNMIDRAITSNTVSSIFANSTPYINDGPDYGQTYTITLTSAVGRFGNSAANAVSASSYSYTGNLTQTNNEFGNIKFVPNYNLANSTTSFTYTQSRDGQSQVNTSPVLTVTRGANIDPTDINFTADSTWTPTFEEAYFGNTKIVVVGGGGGGAGAGTVSAPIPGGGGAGGDVTVAYLNANAAVKLEVKTYDIVIGAGGSGSLVSGNFAQGANGGYSALQYANANIVAASGGGGGIAINTPSTGSRGGNNSSYIGGNSAGTGNTKVAGGGAGAGANGQTAIGINAGDGGAGLLITLGDFGTERLAPGGGDDISTISQTYGDAGAGASSGGEGNGSEGQDGIGAGGGGGNVSSTVGNGSGGSGVIYIVWE